MVDDEFQLPVVAAVWFAAPDVTDAHRRAFLLAPVSAGAGARESRLVRLVRELCRARNKLLRCYPSVVHEIPFYTSHPRRFRHARWKLIMGAWLYWAIGGLSTRRPRLLSLGDMAREEPIIETGDLDGLPYIAMQLVDGRPLEALSGTGAARLRGPGGLSRRS